MIAIGPDHPLVVALADHLGVAPSCIGDFAVYVELGDAAAFLHTFPSQDDAMEAVSSLASPELVKIEWGVN